VWGKRSVGPGPIRDDLRRSALSCSACVIRGFEESLCRGAAESAKQGRDARFRSALARQIQTPPPPMSKLHITTTTTTTTLCLAGGKLTSHQVLHPGVACQSNEDGSEASRLSASPKTHDRRYAVLLAGHCRGISTARYTNTMPWAQYLKCETESEVDVTVQPSRGSVTARGALRARRSTLATGITLPTSQSIPTIACTVILGRI
jgi:hypothetical protein